MAAQTFLMGYEQDGGITKGWEVTLTYDDGTLLISTVTAQVAGFLDDGYTRNECIVTLTDPAASPVALNQQNQALANGDGSPNTTTWDISGYGSKFPSGTKTYKGRTVPDWSTTSFNYDVSGVSQN